MIRQERPAWRRLQLIALLIGAIAMVLTLIGCVTDPRVALSSYLVAFVTWLGPALGGVAVVMVRHLIPGHWGLAIQRPLEAAGRTLPLLAILFLPIAFGAAWLYPWANAGLVQDSHLMQHRQPYLSLPFFLIRTAVYFAIWIGLAHLLSVWSRERNDWRLRALSGPGLLLYGLTATFAAVDWVMSLNPAWFSSIYGTFFITGQGISAFAFAILVAFGLARDEHYGRLLSPGLFRDLGNLLLTFLLLWAYVNVCQLIIIWSGNISAHTTWYVQRITDGWLGVTVFLAIAHFALPFGLLLFRAVKEQPERLAGVALGLLLLRTLDHTWHVMPSLVHFELAISVWNVVPLFGIGGLWLALYLRELDRIGLVPPAEARLEEAPSHG